MSKKRNSITMTEVEHNNAYDNMIYTIENDDQPQPPPPHLLGRRRSHAFSFSENENDKPNDDPINKILTEQDVNGNVITDQDPDFLFTTIIPPVAILVALILAGIVGCCFHRANRKRKSLEISRISGDPIHPEREAFLQKGRKPIIFEFEQQQQQQQQYHSNPPNTLISPVIMPPGQQQQPQQVINK